MLPLAIRSQFKDVVSIQLVTGSDAYGEESLASAVSVRCRVSYRDAMVSTPGGDEVRTSVVLYMDDLPGLTAEAAITLPDGRTLAPKSIRRPAWPSGARHLEVVL